MTQTLEEALVKINRFANAMKNSAEHLIALCGCNHEPCSCVGLDGRPLAPATKGDDYQPLGFRTSDVPDPYNSPPPASDSLDDVADALRIVIELAERPGMSTKEREAIVTVDEHCSALAAPSPAPAPASHDDVAREEFDKFAAGYDLESNEWLDMDVPTFFAAGYAAALRRAAGERERLAKMIEEYAMEKPPGGQRLVLVIAAKDVRRGRRLTDKEQLTNLQKAMDEFDAEEAAPAPASHDDVARDAADRLAQVLYGRNAKARDMIGGSDARIFDDAAATLRRAAGTDVTHEMVDAALFALRENRPIPGEFGIHLKVGDWRTRMRAALTAAAQARAKCSGV